MILLTYVYSDALCTALELKKEFKCDSHYTNDINLAQRPFNCSLVPQHRPCAPYTETPQQ